MKKFFFGVATAAHQIEGNNIYNDWWYNEQEGKYKTPSGIACNSYEMYREDNDCIQDMGCNSYRFSIEWSRIEKSPGQYDDKEILHYVNMIDDMLKKGIEPMVTLHHFTNPLWFELLGGWEKKQNAQHFLDYLKYLLPYLKGKVKYFVTFNEPNTYVASKYIGRVWHPFGNNFLTGYRVWMNILHAHRSTYIVLKKLIPDCQVGYSVQCVRPGIHKKRDIWKIIPTYIAAQFSNHFAFSQLKHRYLDFLGAQFYSRLTIQLDLKLVPPIKLAPDLMSPDMQFDQHAKDILYILNELKRYKLPIMITENGWLGPNDEKRCKYLVDVFKRLDPYIKERTILTGYYYWSLLDNFEWSFGFKPKFGLYSVDPDTYKRIAKPSATVFKEIIKSYK